MVTCAVAGLLLLGGCGAPASKVAALGPGSVAPPALAASADTAVRATWVFDGADLLRCRNSARELRRLQARFGERVEIAAVAVDAERETVESFMRNERIRASVRYLEGGGGRDARGVQRPALYLVKGRTVAAVYLGVPFDDAESIEARDVEGAVASLLGRSGASGIAGENHSSRSNS
jgi:hypothetical protein